MVRTPVRLVPLVALAFVAAACGGTDELCLRHGIKCDNLPHPKVYELNWVEHAKFGAHPIAVFRVRRIEIDSDGWKVDASFTNQSPVTLVLPKGGPNSPKDFGLGVFTTPLPQRIEEPGNYLLNANTTTPRLPSELRPGQTWSGTMSSDVPPRSLRWVRVLFGVFFWKGKAPYSGLGPYFLWQTSHSVHAPPPVGSS